MALADTANLVVKLSLAGNYRRQLAGAQSAFGKLDATLSRTEGRAFRAGQQIGTGIRNAAGIAAVGLGILAGNVAMGLQSLIRLEEATAQTEAVIKSTGGAAGITADKVRELAEKYEALNATIGDETIQQGQNLLLTFTAITEDAFEPALQAALDLSTAMGTDLDSAIKTVGKALSEPEKAMARLRRQGIILTESEEAQIKAHLKNNDALGAQRVILDALDTRYGGSFLAKGNTTAGKVAKFTDSIEDLQRALAGALLPAVSNIADALTEFLSDPRTVRDFERLGQQIGELFSPENIRNGIDALRDGFNFLRSVAGPIADVVGTAVRAFTSLPPEVQKLLVGGFAANKLTGGLITNIAGGIFGALKAMTVQAAVVNVTGGVVNGGPGLPGGAKGGGKPGLPGGAAVGFLGAAGLAIGLGAVATEVSGLRDDTHVIGGQIARGTNDVEQQVANVKNNIAVLTERAANGDQNAQRQLEGQRAVLARLLDESSTTSERLAALRDQANRTKDDTVAASNKTTTAALETKREAGRGLSLVNSATRAGASQVASAVRNSRPIITTNVKVTVTAGAVSKSVSQQARYGPANGSHGGGGGHAPGTGPLP